MTGEGDGVRAAERLLLPWLELLIKGGNWFWRLRFSAIDTFFVYKFLTFFHLNCSAH